MSLKLDLARVQANVESADTEDLLDRVTFYRAGMEPEAIEIIERELRKRGVREEEIEKWGPQEDEEYIWREDGSVAPCSFCRRPAVQAGWRWHRLWGLVPLFPRVYRFCADHWETQ